MRKKKRKMMKRKKITIRLMFNSANLNPDPALENKLLALRVVVGEANSPNFLFNPKPIRPRELMKKKMKKKRTRMKKKRSNHNQTKKEEPQYLSTR